MAATPAPARTACLDDSTGAEFVEGLLPPETRRSIDAHIASCADCRRLVSELARGLDAAPAAEPDAAASAVDAQFARTVPEDGGAPREPAASPVREGDVVAGKYRVERVLGVGGMGVVVAAIHVELEHRVALKFLRPEAASDPRFALRFAREARASARIDSEHVARTIDVGALPSGAPYMVLEHLDGDDLERVLRREGPLSIERATDYVREACEGVAQAHALGIIHRDLKPSNLFLAKRPNRPPIVKVLDFGISKSTADPQVTTTATALGSPRYMSPEQMSSARSVDARADVWALGVVLYELLTHRPPFRAQSVPELVLAIAHGAHVPIRSTRDDVPAALEAAIQRCLEKDPERRFGGVDELARALAPFSSAGSEAKSGVAAQVPASSANGARSRRTLVALPLLVGVAALAVWRGAGKGDERAVGLEAAARARLEADAGPATVARATASVAPVIEEVPPGVDAGPADAPSVRSTAVRDRPRSLPVADTASPALAPSVPVSNGPCRTVGYFDAEGYKHFRQECP
ncbi:MAG TPA: protein kinase [Byssovorax sp.]|jgi:serine/threonine-protein kinase